jgi:autotransporter translocation and assembly factor TamB
MSVARRSLQIVAFIATLVVGVASMAVIVTQTTWFKEWLRGFIVRQAEDYVNGRLSIGRLDGNLFFGVELEDVDVTMNGQKVVEVKDVGLDYNVFTFLGGDVVLDDIRLNKPIMRLEKTPQGWNLTELIKARTPDPNEPKWRRTLAIGEIGITDGELYFGGAQPVGTSGVETSGVEVPERIDKLNASLGVATDENALTVDIGHMSLRAHEPEFGVNDLSGRIVRTANEVTFEKVALRTEETSLLIGGAVRNIESGKLVLDLKASSDKLAVEEIARLIPALRGLPLQPAFELSARGPADRLAIELNAREAQVGNVIGDLTVDAVEPERRVAGTVRLAHFNVGPVVKSKTLESDISGQGQLDLTLPSGQQPLSGTYSIDASRAMVAGYEARNLKAKGRIDGDTVRLDGSAAAYGGRATAVGTVKIAQPLELDLKGRAANVDLRNLPPQLKAPGVPSNLQFDYDVTGRGSVFSGDVRLQTSTLAGATIAPGTTASFTVGDGAPSYAADGSVSNLDLQNVGRGFDIRALAADRFRSRINASFSVKGSGGGSTPLNLDASGVATDSELFGASFPRMDFKTSFAGPDAQVRALGQFADLDPAVVSGNERVAGKVTGAVDVNATLRDYRDGVTVDSIDASGRVNLGNSNIAKVSIDSAVFDGTYADRVGQLNQFSIAGPDVHVNGQGTIALNDTGASNMTVHAESPSLDRIGEMIGQPIKGAAIVDAKITGNGRELQAAGTLKGSNVGHGDSEALNLDTTFTLRVPELRAADAALDAKSRATLVEIAGQRITELTAETKYSGRQLDFDATAKEGVRAAGAAGSVVFHPEHKEIHVRTLSLRSGTVEWRTAPESQAAVQYGKDRIAIENMRLVNGDQRIEADGVIGSPSESLKVRADNVDVAQLEQLMLTNRGISGRLNVTGTVSGRTDALRANGEFQLAPGAFKTFKFERLGGTAEYAPGGVKLDVRLEQTPQAWLTAKGFAPVSLFRPTTEAERGRAGEPVDLHLESSAVDLGIVQGFTRAVSQVSGTFQVNLHVTGTGYDPDITGAVDVRKGAFGIPYLKTAYTGLDSRIEFKQDLVEIQKLTLVDEHKHILTLSGALATDQRQIGKVDVKIQSQGFEVIDNELADLKLDTDVRVTGELRAPKVVGSVEVETGTVDVSRVVEQATADPYATEATELEPAAGQNTVQSTLFDALDLEIGLAVPSNLVLKGSDIRPANAPISIGDINVTVGGAIQLRKPRGEKMRLIGEVNTVRGRYDFQGRRFEILRAGRIRFSGAEEIDPVLDLNTRRIISGVETFVHVRGTLKQPEVTFSSNPPLDEADILSLIVFNAPINELGEGQQVSLAERAAALAGGYLASGLTRSIADVLELDEFEIVAGDQGLGPSLTVGEQVGEKLFLRLRQGFGAEQATEMILEYQIADFLRFQGSVAETSGGAQRSAFRRIERGGLDLIFFFSY